MRTSHPPPPLIFFSLFFSSALFPLSLRATRYALMQQCWATQLAERPALADVTRQLQAMCTGQARGASLRITGDMAIVNPAFEAGSLTEASEL
jgi:hypothetical protein